MQTTIQSPAYYAGRADAYDDIRTLPVHELTARRNQIEDAAPSSDYTRGYLRAADDALNAHQASLHAAINVAYAMRGEVTA